MAESIDHRQWLVQSLVLFVIAGLLAIITALSAFLLTRNASVLDGVQAEQRRLEAELVAVKEQMQAQQYAIGLEIQELAFKQVLNKATAARAENLQLLTNDELEQVKKQLVTIAPRRKKQ